MTDTEKLCACAANGQFIDKACQRWGGLERTLLAEVLKYGLNLLGVTDWAATSIAAGVASALVEVSKHFDLPPWET